MSHSRRTRMKIEAEHERTRSLLRTHLEGSKFTQSEVALRCGWSNSRLSRLVHGSGLIRVKDLLKVLQAIQVRSGDFYFRLYR